MPARYGGGFGFLLRVRSHVRRAEWLMSAGLHIRLGKKFIMFQTVVLVDKSIPGLEKRNTAPSMYLHYQIYHR